MEVVPVVIGVLVAILVIALVVAVVLNARSLGTKLATAATVAANALVRTGAQFAAFGAAALRGTVVFAGAAVQTFVGALQQTADAFDTVATWATGAFDRALRLATATLTGAVQQTSGIFAGAMDQIANFTVSIARAAANLATEGFVKGITALADLVSRLVRFLIEQLQIAFFTVQDALFGAASTIAQFFINIGAQIAAAIAQLTAQWSSVQDFLTTTFGPAIDAIVDAANAVFDALLAVFCAFCEFCRVIPFCSRPDPCFDFC